MKPQKILYWDIETSFLEAYVFSLRNQVFINPDNVRKDWHIICGSWMTADSDVVHSVACEHISDREVVKKLREAVLDCDILVHHNGDRFDLKKLNTRIIKHGLPPLPPIITIDTLKELRKVAEFTSNKLDYIGKFLSIGQKAETEKDLWVGATNGDPEKIRKIVAYCRQDVRLLKQCHLYLAKYFKNQPSIYRTKGAYCPQCGSIRIIKQGFKMFKTGRHQRFQCMSCGAWSMARQNLNEKPGLLRI